MIYINSLTKLRWYHNSAVKYSAVHCTALQCTAALSSYISMHSSVIQHNGYGSEVL